MKPIMYLTAVATLFIAWGCKKNSPHNISPAVDTLIYAFTYTGTPCIGDTLTFTAKEPAGTSYSWSFGDGATSISANPTHQYADSGNYSITLTLNGDATHVISLPITIYKDPLYTHLAAGAHTWLHKHYVLAGLIVDSVISDTSLSVTVVNAVTLVFAGEIFTYSPSMSSGNYIVYTYSFHTSENSYGDGQLSFNYINDSINISSYTHPGPGLSLILEDVYRTL